MSACLCFQSESEIKTQTVTVCFGYFSIRWFAISLLLFGQNSVFVSCLTRGTNVTW